MYTFIFIKSSAFFLPFCSGQINSLHYVDETTEKEYICSAEDSSGMHKCHHLPLFIHNGMECYSR